MSKYLIVALIFVVADVIVAGGTTPAKVHYADAGYSDDCDAYCLLYDYPHSTYHYSHYPYYWYGGRYWGGLRYWGGQPYPTGRSSGYNFKYLVSPTRTADSLSGLFRCARNNRSLPQSPSVEGRSRD